MLMEKLISENPICFWELAFNHAQKSARFFENVSDPPALYGLIT